MDILVNRVEVVSQTSFNPQAPILGGTERTQRGFAPLHAPIGISGFELAALGTPQTPAAFCRTVASNTASSAKRPWVGPETAKHREGLAANRAGARQAVPDHLEVTDEADHAWGADDPLEVGVALLVQVLEARFLVGALARRIADEEADLGLLEARLASLINDRVE